MENFIRRFNMVEVDKRKKSKIHYEIDAIIKKNKGVITQELIVKEAQKNGTAIHEDFKKRGLFDPQKAMQYAQLTYARVLLMHYKVWVSVDQKEPVKVRALVNLRDERSSKQGGYRPIISVMSDMERRKKLLSDALADMAAFRTKYQILTELEPVFEAMEKVKA
jgi:hypothetical protein